MPAITSIDKEAIALGPKISPSNHTAWLEQLESAQWQQRQCYQPGSDQRQSGDSASAQRVAQQPARHGSRVDISQPTPLERQAGAAPNSSAQNTQLTAQPAAFASQTMQARPAFGLGLPVLQQTPVGTATRHGQAGLPLRQLVAINWQAQNAHVMAGNEGLRMWLRDARYENSDGRRLLLELRARFARLGFRLAEFTLNGEQVAGPDQANQSN